MTYEQIKIELKEQGLKEEFCSLLEVFLTNEGLIRLNTTNKIHSTASLIRMLISYLPFMSKVYDYWVLVLQWFMHPIFARPRNISEWLTLKS